jgi:ribosome-associated heat shock protein Hsp15
MDKWLWQARFFRSRSLAGKICNAGHVRVDGERVEKAHFAVRIGQVLTFSQARRIRVVRVLALGTRRGPASQAQALYEDLSDPAPVPGISAVGPLSEAVLGRPVPGRWSHENRRIDRRADLRRRQKLEGR